MMRFLAMAWILALVGCGATEAQFVVERVDARRDEQGIRVDVDLDLSLTDATEKALAHGVPLIIVHDITLRRNGWFWDRSARAASERHRLRYSALSGQYVLDRDGAALDTFRSVNDALERISSAAAHFDVPGGDAGYSVAVRSRIDINELPAPLRPTALFSPQWQLSSDWSQWPVDASSTN